MVLMPEECKLRVGGMSIIEPRSQLGKFWGQDGVPGAAVEDGYQDMWVPSWVPNGHTDDPYHLSWHILSLYTRKSST